MVNPKKTKQIPPQRRAWDRPDPAPQGDDSADALFSAVGEALSAWERVENQVANLFCIFVGARVNVDKPAPAIRAYGAIISFTSRADMLQAAAAAYFLSHPQIAGQQETWSNLLKELRGFANRRNDIAHGMVEQEFNFKEERSNGFFLVPGLYISKKYPTDEPPAYRFIGEQVKHFADEFSDLANSVRVFRFALQTKRRTSPRKYRQPKNPQ
jgi:hypothetical protein